MAYVTDHCVLRYLERVHGIDVEGIRDELTGDIASTCLGYANPRKRVR